MDKSQKNTNAIITGYSATCGIVAAFPIPFFDIFILTPIQGVMGIHIAKAHGIEVSKQEMKDIILQFFGVIGMGVIAQQVIIRGVYKLIPFYGAITTIPVVFAFSFAIGKVMDVYFEKKSQGIAMSDQEIKDTYKSFFSLKKKEAKSMKKSDFEKLSKEVEDDENLQEELEKIKKK